MTTQALPSRADVRAALQEAIDAVDACFETREIHPSGERMHFCLVGHETEVARVLLPVFSGTHLGRIIRHYGREFISDYAPPTPVGESTASEGEPK